MYPGYPTTNYVGVPQNVSPYPIQVNNPYGQPTYQVQTQFVQTVSPSPQPNYQVTSYVQQPQGNPNPSLAALQKQQNDLMKGMQTLQVQQQQLQYQHGQQQQQHNAYGQPVQYQVQWNNVPQQQTPTQIPQQLSPYPVQQPHSPSQFQTVQLHQHQPQQLPQSQPTQHQQQLQQPQPQPQPHSPSQFQTVQPQQLPQSQPAQHQLQQPSQQIPTQQTPTQQTQGQRVYTMYPQDPQQFQTLMEQQKHQTPTQPTQTVYPATPTHGVNSHDQSISTIAPQRPQNEPNTSTTVFSSSNDIPPSRPSNVPQSYITTTVANNVTPQRPTQVPNEKPPQQPPQRPQTDLERKLQELQEMQLKQREKQQQIQQQQQQQPQQQIQSTVTTNTSTSGNDDSSSASLLSPVRPRPSYSDLDIQNNVNMNQLNINGNPIDNRHYIVYNSDKYIVLHDSYTKASFSFEKGKGSPAAIPYREDHLAGSTAIKSYLILGIVVIEGVHHLIIVTEKIDLWPLCNSKIFLIKDVAFIPFKPLATMSQVSYSDLMKFICSGLLYYSFSYHLTLSQQVQSETQSLYDSNGACNWKAANRKYFWNYYLLRHFIRKSSDSWVVPVIRGFVRVQKNIENKQFDLTVISRICCLKAGTRYNSRGVNDDGNVANFVETEQIVVYGDIIASFLQIRGSVPIFWEQNFRQGKWAVDVLRSPDSTLPAFQKHFESIIDSYNKIVCVDLLDAKKKESQLTQNYGLLLTSLSNNTKTKDKIKYHHWDFHSYCGKTCSKIDSIESAFIPKILDDISSFRFFQKNLKTGQVIEKQNGIFRTNCLDCLDRTNFIQSRIGFTVFQFMIATLGLASSTQISHRSFIGTQFINMCADSGDNISKSYAGTGAMKAEYARTGKRTMKGMIDDAAKSAVREYKQTFSDDNKQVAIDMFLGNIEEEIESELPIQELWVKKQLAFRQHFYSQYQTEKIFIGTWNVGAGTPNTSNNECIDPWLSFDYPANNVSDHNIISLYVFGIQEIVTLNASSVIQADEKNMGIWANILMDSINRKRHPNNRVILAGKVQLVGIAIIIFICEGHLNSFKNFEIQKAKVAIKGFAGNKGALVARFDFYDTSICCVCAHLSAVLGQSHNSERLKDIVDIQKNTSFSNNQFKTINDHDHQFWFGDLNFRIELTQEEVLTQIKKRDYLWLANHDQLTLARMAGTALYGFHEGPLLFPPTYKYTFGSDVYDTARIPAWCDRVLWKHQNTEKAELLSYNRGDGVFISDHRPVKALFNIDIKIVNLSQKEKIHQQLISLSQTIDDSHLASVDTPYQMEVPMRKITQGHVQNTNNTNMRSSVSESSSEYNLAISNKSGNSEYKNTTQSTLYSNLAALNILKDLLQKSFGDTKTIKQLTNLIVSCLKKILLDLISIRSCDIAQSISKKIISLEHPIVQLSKACVMYPNDSQSHDNYVRSLSDITNYINLHGKEIK